jgi:hypothetical protein
MTLQLRPNFVRAPAVHFLINIGAGFDIPTGSYLRGKYGEHILNGGLGILTGFCGKPNTFKSTTAHYGTVSALARISSTVESAADLYDTEINVKEEHLHNLTQTFDIFKGRNILDEGIWQVSNKERMTGDQWFDAASDFMQLKKKEFAKYAVEIPFLDRDGKNLVKIPLPTFNTVDSFSAFSTSDVEKIQDEVVLGDSKGNMVHMRQGLAKLRFLQQMPTLAAGSSTYSTLVAHIGDEQPIQAGPVTLPPEKQLQHMPSGKKVMGVTKQFLYLMSNFWLVVSSKPKANKGNRDAEYPLTKDDVGKQEGIDLYEVTVKQLRGKAGGSGFTIDLIVSETEGVLASMTEFNMIREAGGYFGLDGGTSIYSLSIYPDVKLSRNTIRQKTRDDPKLCRALNITSELFQMDQYYGHLRDEMPTPQDLYKKIKEAGYDWDFILTHTRGWATVNNDNHPTLWFLSTYDIVRMANGVYHPYWLEDDKKTIKKEFQKKAVQL